MCVNSRLCFPGQYNYAVVLQQGIGVDKSASAAVDWFRKSAAQGYAFAQVSGLSSVAFAPSTFCPVVQCLLAFA